MTMSMEKGDEAAIGSLRPCSKKTKTLESVCGDGAPSAATSDKYSIGRLRRMVKDLEEMDTAWRGALISQPSHDEQILYMFILGRVSSEIFLFHREKNTRPEEETTGFIVKELSDRGSAFGIALTGSNDLNIIGGEEEDDDVEDKPSTALMSLYMQILDLAVLMEKLRDSISQGPTPEKLEAEIEIGVEEETQRLQTLRDILCSLAERRCDRSYAPPVDEELACYREIRKWVISTITFIDGKHSWMDYWERHLRTLGVAECGNRSLVERVRIGRGEWHRFFLCHHIDLRVMFYPPVGHQIALAFDQVSELLSLLSEWRRRFSDITSRFLKGELVDVTGCTYGGVKVKVDVGKSAGVEEETKKKEKKRNHSLFSVDDVSDQAFKSRAQYLVHISSISLSEDTMSCLSSREVGLFARILEHVVSSIWLFHKKATPREVQVYNEYNQKIYKKRTGKKKNWDLLKYTSPLVSEAAPWRGTREENLQEIVRMVEEIELSFLCSPPTAREMIVYEKMKEQMCMSLLEPRFYQELPVPDHHAYQVARCLLNDTCAMEMELLRQLNKEFGDTFRTIFPGAPQDTQVLEWLKEHKEDATSMLRELVKNSALGLEYLDRLSLSLHEAHFLVSHSVRNFVDGNMVDIDDVLRQKKYQGAILDCWAALNIAEASGFIKDGGNTKL